MKTMPILLCALAMVATSCKREERRFREPTPSTVASNSVTMSGLHPANPTQGTVPPNSPVNNAYEQSAYAVSEGEKLFNQYNCSGCHAHGGGGIGPPLMDQTWIYGSQPQNVFMTIVEGRPNGMPSFRGKIPDQQVWELVAYVRSLSGQLPIDVAPGRSDHMYGPKPPENSKKLNPRGPEGTEKQ
jgi:cytochrome c oxidase cbb3-type subunit III